MRSAEATNPVAIFDRVVCAIDGTPASIEAARLLGRLMPALGRVTLCSVVNPYTLVSEGGIFTERAVTQNAEEALQRAEAELLPRLTPVAHLRRGTPVPELLHELRQEHATLLALGGHGHSRAAGIMTGSVASGL